MLKQRVATALVLLSLFLIAVFWLPTPLFAAALGLVTLAASHEWARLAGFDDRLWHALWLFGIGASLALIWWFRQSALAAVILAGAVWWTYIAWRLWRSPAAPASSGLRIAGGMLVLLPVWSALVYLHQVSLSSLLALFIIVWMADTGAYFCGRRFGRRKLAPAISPGKTIEGMAGGMIGVGLLAAVSAVWYGSRPWCAAAWVAACVATAVFSVVGDLWESKMKRMAGVKDSGNILPGHGGVLDRIDSVSAAAPVFVSTVYLGAAEIGLCARVS